jgi:hypothetical protein
MPDEVTKNVYPAKTPSTQRKTHIYIPNLGALCVFARDILFPLSSSIENFKYLWLDLRYFDLAVQVLDFRLRAITDFPRPLHPAG